MEYNRYKPLPNAIRRYRRAIGLSQRELAGILGFRDKTWVSHWENGDALPNLVSAIRLSILFGVTVNDLFDNLASAIQGENRPRASVISLSGGVQGVPEDIEQAKGVPEGQGTEAEGCGETPEP